MRRLGVSDRCSLDDTRRQRFQMPLVNPSAVLDMPRCLANLRLHDSPAAQVRENRACKQNPTASPSPRPNAQRQKSKPPVAKGFELQ